ncbi:MAG: NADH-quinone oxidoreductase subunit L [Candidatus Cyclobacteriaceae bacterium M3_2C_046]
MINFLWLILLLPLAGFLVLALFGSKLSKKMVAMVGLGSVGTAAFLTILLGLEFIINPIPDHGLVNHLWTWFDVAGLSPGITLYLDALSLIFVFVITFVGFLIHLYSVEFMWDEEGYARFFAYMNLFVGSMLTLVLADNLVLLYLGWEGVGLCSFLLIGFWYKDPVNGAAARKAFIVTRIGDTAMAIGLFLLFFSFNSLNINEIMTAIPQKWAQGDPTATWAAILLLGGALGKSAQLPLQTWLPDAMAGPSPVSALIHAATMVTAGIYLIARTHTLFIQVPAVMTVIAVIGALTLLLAGLSALVQSDIKRVLAYSTISQIGYMFLALGVGAWSAAVFHFMIHAFFKALLFLGAGAIILAMHHEHNMFKMGGLKAKLPVTFWTFLIGSASLAALPLITAGFYSKDAILWYAWASPTGSPWLWLSAVTGAFITAIYTFRMLFITFFGSPTPRISQKPGILIKIPLIVLAILSLLGGFLELPHTLGHFNPFSSLMETAVPAVHLMIEDTSIELLFQLISSLLALAGIYLAYLYFLKKPHLSRQLTRKQPGLKNFWLNGWQFDRLYDRVFVRPVVWLSAINKNDVVDKGYYLIGQAHTYLHLRLSQSQTGQLRWYLMGITFGAILTITLIIFL